MNGDAVGGPALARIRAALAAGGRADELGAWILRRRSETVMADAGASAARALPLAGMSLAVKDNIDVAGLTTTAGHPSFAHLAVETAPAVNRLVEAGAIVVGKTNLDQFATGLVGTRSPYGPCRNPLRPDRVAGGSSSGSAVAVATGAATVGIGTDTAGSGRVPAALCGIVGLKPTRGLLSTRGVVPAIAGLDCVSVFARDVGTAVLALSIASGFDREDPWSRRPPIGTPAVSGAPLRIGVPRPPEPVDLDDEAGAAWNSSLRSMAGLGPVVEVDVSSYLEAGTLLYGGGLVSFRANAFGDFLAEHPDGADPHVASIVGAGAGLAARRLAADLERLQRLRRQMEHVWAEVDVLAVPTVGSAPTLTAVAADPLVVNSRLGRWTNGANLLDLCAAAVPCGWRDDGIPFGVTILGPAFGDAVVAQASARLMGEPDPALPSWAAPATLVVVGAHLTGQTLNRELIDRGARLVRTCSTAAAYRLYALRTDPPKPGLLRVPSGGASIAAELWSLPVDGFGDFVRRVPPPLSIGTVELEDGTCHPGFLCEGWAIAGATDITAHGGWIRYQRAQEVQPA
ncbi:MAG TPA: allophanate hydrolase [Acidimicrobiales bacterium]